MDSLRIGLLGFGNVSIALIRHYLSISDMIEARYRLRLDFTYVCDSKKVYHVSQTDITNLIKEKEGGLAEPKKMTETLDEFEKIINNNKIDLLIDCLPTSKHDAGPTYPLLIKALKNNISIICVNKAPLVFGGEKILAAAEKYRTRIGFSGTTAGCLPSSGMILHELIGSGIYQVRGILNGTSNYVLDSVIYKGLSMKEAIQKAVDLGIAEPDCEYDLSGLDTCFKMIILGLLITGKTKPLEEIDYKGVLGLETDYIRRLFKEQKLLRLIGNLNIRNQEPEISVAPEEIDDQDPLYGVHGSGKGITFRTKHMGDLTITGGSSGRINIAAAILKDIINISKSE